LEDRVTDNRVFITNYKRNRNRFDKTMKTKVGILAIAQIKIHFLVPKKFHTTHVNEEDK